jgi:acetyl esterase/lipase
MTAWSPSAQPYRSPDRCRYPLTRLVLAVVLGLPLACGTTGPSAHADHGPADTGRPAGSHPRRIVPGTAAAQAGVMAAPVITPGPDALDDPGVGPGECRLVVYTPPGAVHAQSGELCRPDSDQRDVAVIIVHGGAGVAGTYAGLRPWADRYRREGYVTFLPDYHLFRPGSRERPVFPRPEQNIKAAVQYVRGVAGALGVRGDRVAVQGHSAGARLGAVAYTTADDDWFAGPELHDGISCALDAFIGFYHPYDGTMTHSDQYFGGNTASRDPATLRRLDRANSLRRAGSASGPALFLTGSRDWNLIAAQQAAFAAALRADYRDARTVIIEGGGHGFDEGDGVTLPRLGEEAARHTLDFLADTFPAH